MKTLLPALLMVLLAAGAAAQTDKPESKARQAKSSASQDAGAPAAEQAEIDALKADLARMNAILNQMRTNLGYVASTTQPLRHQFELEIDMWQMQLRQMERRIRKLEAKARQASPPNR